MTVSIILLFLLCLYKLKWAGKGYFENYLDREQTDAVKGIFVVMVFLSHFRQYVTLQGSFEKIYLIISACAGQLIVAMFLFYSGYGIACSAERKGREYISSLPRKKILHLLLRFDAVVIVYVLLAFLLGRRYSLFRVALALTGLTSVGNSNWYIFAVLWCYIFTWAAYRIYFRTKLDPLVPVAVFTVLYCVILYLGAFPKYYYSTVFCYAAGLWYGRRREKIEAFLKSGAKPYYGTLIAEIVFMGCLAVVYVFTKAAGIYIALAAIFSIFVVQFTMKVRICNKPLTVLGNYVFEVYILQRLPMTALAGLPLTRSFVMSHKYIYLILCIMITALLSWAYKKIEERYM